MKLTKFQHACLVLEKEGTIIVIDPGAYSHDFIIPSKVDAVVITHDHPDHFDHALLDRIVAAHPTATIIGHDSITSQFSEAPTAAVTAGSVQTIGSFSLSFFGGSHASITDSMPVPPNLGVLVDNHLYYPGDSFYVPEVPVTELALPVSAPWLAMYQVFDFVNAVKPSFIFPTHDAILSDDGKQLADTMVGGVAHAAGSTYKRLDGATIEL